MRHKAQLAKAPAAQIQEKYQLINKFSTLRDECVGIPPSLDGARHVQQSFHIPRLTDACREVATTSLTLRQEVTSLVHRLKGRKCKREGKRRWLRGSRSESPWKRL